MYLEYFDKFLNMKPYLSIDEKEWEHIKNTFDKEDVKESLAKVAMTYEIPYAEISKKDAHRDYLKLKGMKHTDILVNGEWFAREGTEDRYGLSFQGKQQYFRRINTGNQSSNYFQQANRWSVDGSVSPGPQRTWGNEKFMTSLMGSAYSLKLPRINRNVLRTMIGLRKYICAQFKPNVSKVLYDKLNSKNILDFSAGWGDRLAGFYASETAEYYVGVDPRKENHPIYHQQSKFYDKHKSIFEPDKTCEFICKPAEDVDFTKYEDTFDTVFTSPPYFNVERYSYDDTQSWVKYKEINEWNENFLQQTLKNLWCSVKSGGYLLVNISDVYSSSKSSKSWLEICNPMNDFLSTFTDSEYQGCIGMELAKRPNSGGAGTAKSEDYTEEALNKAEETKDKTFCEPIWIWRKI